MSRMKYTYKDICKLTPKTLDKIVDKASKQFDTSSPLYELIMDDEKIYQLILTASENKRHRGDVLDVIGMRYSDKEYSLNNKYSRMYRTIMYLRIMVLTHSYVPENFVHHEILDGAGKKKREILVPDFRNDLLIQYLAIELIYPYIQKIHYNYSCASYPDKGRIYARNYLVGCINKYKYTYERQNRVFKGDPLKYFMKLDVKQFFPSIKHRTLKKKIRRYIKDKETLFLIDKIIDSTDYGIPIGFYSSQWLANFLLTDLDHFIKERIISEGKRIGKDLRSRSHRTGVKIYVRYMDDMIFFASNKKLLGRIRMEIEDKLHEMGLELKGNWTIQLFDAPDYDYIKKFGPVTPEMRKENPRLGRVGIPLDFVGYRFYREYTILRMSTYKRLIRFVNRLKKKGIKYITRHQAYKIISYYGILKWADTKIYERDIRPFAPIKYFKKLISHYQKIENEKLRPKKEALKKLQEEQDADDIYMECLENFILDLPRQNISTLITTGMDSIRENSIYFKSKKEENVTR